MTLLLVCVAIAVVGGVAVLVARDRPLIDDDPVAARQLLWPPEGRAVRPGDLDEARFTVALRGYRMDEVDRVLDDAAAALAERDRRIAELEREEVDPPARGEIDPLTRGTADPPEDAAVVASEGVDAAE